MTGLFTRKITKGAARAGRPCGSIGSSGYLRIMIDGKSYLAHRLVWLIMTGDWPSHEIDHINFIKTDNIWTNLREATRAQNAQYKIITSSLPRGVVFYKGRFVAKIHVNGQHVNLGRYDSAEQAQKVYETASRVFFGDFAPVKLSLQTS